MGLHNKTKQCYPKYLQSLQKQVNPRYDFTFPIMPGLNYRNATMKMRMTVDENIKQAIQKMYELERNFMGRMSSQRAS